MQQSRLWQRLHSALQLQVGFHQHNLADSVISLSPQGVKHVQAETRAIRLLCQVFHTDCIWEAHVHHLRDFSMPEHACV